ncbi:MAG: hypothetical protein RI101_00095 [Nitrospira sp.]|nr:hypothetical protein [Nitrospira sp.]
MAGYLRDRQIPLIVILIPDQIQVDPLLREEFIAAFSIRDELYDFGRPQALFHAWCVEHDVPCIDLRKDFARQAKPSDLFLQNDMHWSVAGHALASETIFAKLRPVVMSAAKDHRAAEN